MYSRGKTPRKKTQKKKNTKHAINGQQFELTGTQSANIPSLLQPETDSVFTQARAETGKTQVLEIYASNLKPKN